MIVNLDTRRLKTLEDIRAFLGGSTQFDLSITERAAACRWIEDTLRQLRYATRGKVDTGTVRAYLEQVTGLSRAQVTRLIGQCLLSGKVRDRRGPPAKPCRRQYTPADIRLLAATDVLHEPPAGPAVRKLCERAFEIFGDADYARRARSSSSPVYNRRQSTGYRRQRPVVEKTRPTTVKRGERRKPRPEGKPGFPRIDSLHQGDFDGIKGLWQRRRRGHAMAGHLQHPEDQRALPGAQPRSPHPELPLPHPRMPRRQRRGVRQPPGRRPPVQAEPRVHPGTVTTDQRPCAGRAQERLRGPQAGSPPP